MSVPAALINEMTEQGVTDLFEISHGHRGLRQLDQGLVAGSIDLYCVDQRLQCG